MSETPYAETELLLAVMQGDDERAAALAEDMMPNERRQLAEHLNRAGDFVHYLCDECGRYVPAQPKIAAGGRRYNPPPGPEDRVLVTIHALSPDRQAKVWHRRCAPVQYRAGWASS